MARFNRTPNAVQAGLHRVTMELRQHAATLPKIIKVDISKVTDWQRRATRLSIAVVFFGILGHCVTFPSEHHVFASNFRQSCNWAAITCIVVTAPLIGKVAQVAFDRLLGTMVGGFIGYLCFTIGFHMFGAVGSGIFISLMSGATVWATTYLAFRYALDQLARFVQLTYIIVAYGAKPDKGAFLLALVRVGGIFIGGLFSMLLAVVVLPRSASVESLREMRKALKELYDLNQEVWALSGVTTRSANNRRAIRKPHRHGYSAMQLHLDTFPAGRGASEPALARTTPVLGVLSGGRPAAAGQLRPSTSDPTLANGSGNGSHSAGSSSDGAGGGGGRGSSSKQLAGGGGLHRGLHEASFQQLGLLVQHDEERDSHEARVEKLFTSVYATLARVDESLAATKGEIYVWHFWGRYFFLPGVHWFPVKGRWQVPCKDLEAMATCLRRVARMLWTLLLDFEEGFGSEMEEVLQLYYPKQLLSELATYQALAIMDLLNAFPRCTTIEVDNLLTLGQLTDCLMQISDARSRTAFFNAKRKRTRAPDGSLCTVTRRSAGGGGPASVAVDTAPGAGPGPVPATETEMARVNGWQSGREVGATADDSAALATDRAIEKVPLLAKQGTQSFTAINAMLPPRAYGATPTKRLSNAGEGSSGGIKARTGSSLSGLLAPERGSSGGGSDRGRERCRNTSASSQGGRDDVSGAVVGGGAGVFISRLLSGQRGGHVALHVTPRKFLMQQEWRKSHDLEGLTGSEGSAGGAPRGSCGGALPPVPSRAGNAGEQEAGHVAAAAVGAAAGMESIDIFGSMRFEDGPQEGQKVEDGKAAAVSAQQLLVKPQGSQLAVDLARAVPQSAPRQSREGLAPCIAAAALPIIGSPLKVCRPSLEGPVPASSSPGRGGPARFLADPSGGTSPAASDRAARPTTSAAVAVFATAAATFSAASNAGAAPSPFLQFARPTQGFDRPSSLDAADRSRVGLGAAANSVSAAGAGPAAAGSDLCFPGFGQAIAHDGPRSALSGLSSMLSVLPVEPVAFPPTEEGYLAQVRWYSFQFVMDEMVNELEEAFHACSAVLQQLPYPIT